MEINFREIKFDKEKVEEFLKHIKSLEYKKPENKVESFEGRLDECEFEVRCRVDYINEQLCNASDDIIDLVRDIEELKVEQDIALELGRDNDVKRIDKEIVRLKEELELLEQRYDVLEDMWDNEYFNVIA